MSAVVTTCELEEVIYGVASYGRKNTSADSHMKVCKGKFIYDQRSA